MSPDVQHNEAEGRFHIPLEGEESAFLLYRKKGKVLDFYRTYVPPQARNRGLAEQVVEAGFRYAQENGFQVIPTCSYVSEAFLPRRKEFLPLVAKNP